MTALSAFLAFVDIGVQINVGYIAIKHRPSSLNRTIGKLWAHTDCVSSLKVHVWRGRNWHMQHLYTLDFSGFDKIKSFERFTISLILRDQRCGKHRHSFLKWSTLRMFTRSRGAHHQSAHTIPLLTSLYTRPGSQSKMIKSLQQSLSREGRVNQDDADLEVRLTN